MITQLPEVCGLCNTRFETGDLVFMNLLVSPCRRVAGCFACFERNEGASQHVVAYGLFVAEEYMRGGPLPAAIQTKLEVGEAALYGIVAAQRGEAVLN